MDSHRLELLFSQPRYEYTVICSTCMDFRKILAEELIESDVRLERRVLELWNEMHSYLSEIPNPGGKYIEWQELYGRLYGDE